MKKITLTLLTFLAVLPFLVTSTNVSSDTNKPILFLENGETDSELLKSENYVEALTDLYTEDMEVYDIVSTSFIDKYTYQDEDGYNTYVFPYELLLGMNEAYQISGDEAPVLFAGDQYFKGYDEIKNAIDNNLIDAALASDFLKPVYVERDFVGEVVYFKETTCIVCQEVESTGLILQLKRQNIEVHIYDIQKSNEYNEFNYTDDDGELQKVQAIDIYTAYNKEYLRVANAGVPVLYVGNQFFYGFEDINDNVEDDKILTLSADSLREVDIIAGQAYDDLTGIVGFFIVLGAGLLDGFNPCAIALLLLFIGLLVGAKDKKILTLVSITYISALFVSYFLIGTFFLSVLSRYQSQIEIIGVVINWFVIILCFVLFALNFYDFIQARNQKYGNIKNQLPKFIQKYNKKIVKAFTNVINNEENKGGLIAVLGLTFILGLTLSITELICTGQIYFGILYGIHTVETGYAYLLLLMYNLMFVLPLIVIAVTSIRMKSVVTISNWIRENLSIIKLVTSLFFLGIFVFFVIRVLSEV